MQFENSFEVPFSEAIVWPVLMDVELTAPCMPGARVTETVDESTWKGELVLRLGPMFIIYRGVVMIQERDDEAHRIVLKAKGKETQGAGTALLKMTTTLGPSEGGSTRVQLISDLSLSGTAATYSRGMVADLSRKLTDQFASCLEELITRRGETTAHGPRKTLRAD